MYEGKPILRKVKRMNLNNPTLNSVGMKGIFYNGTPPPLIRDQLHYAEKYRDSLEREILQAENHKLQDKVQLNQQYYIDKPHSHTVNENGMRYIKRDVLEKVNRIAMEGAADQHYNFNGTRAIKTKQIHGYNIISNF